MTHDKPNGWYDLDRRERRKPSRFRRWLSELLEWLFN